ncbi:MAG: hypothetical protein ABGW81_08680 [Paracoccaceae bacterium]
MVIRLANTFISALKRLLIRRRAKRMVLNTNPVANPRDFAISWISKRQVFSPSAITLSDMAA